MDEGGLSISRQDGSINNLLAKREGNDPRIKSKISIEHQLNSIMSSASPYYSGDSVRQGMIWALPQLYLPRHVGQLFYSYSYLFVLLSQRAGATAADLSLRHRRLAPHVPDSGSAIGSSQPSSQRNHPSCELGLKRIISGLRPNSLKYHGRLNTRRGQALPEAKPRRIHRTRWYEKACHPSLRPAPSLTQTQIPRRTMTWGLSSPRKPPRRSVESCATRSSMSPLCRNPRAIRDP